jgi:hypothetical protein
MAQLAKYVGNGQYLSEALGFFLLTTFLKEPFFISLLSGSGSAKRQMRIRNTSYSVTVYNENCISCGVRYEDVPEPAKPLEIPILYCICSSLIPTPFSLSKYLKGLLQEIFGPVFWTVCMHLGLNVNSFWFFNFYFASSSLDSHLKF